ncbi:ATP-binding protein [Acuticoccus sp. I52.16.1]|uniref:ATP-binding protein n=1 Tax=Acuticoccus sp. I52.16.1 TaxID=2928472 RepID=UPI001FD43F54|nr:ATP-binding protein [Acuticoccus sp. I52.16.1]UOM33161.1 ATP-binding protein [Acuticoccus sp. I52.16.1]
MNAIPPRLVDTPSDAPARRCSAPASETSLVTVGAFAALSGAAASMAFGGPAALSGTLALAALGAAGYGALRHLRPATATAPPASRVLATPAGPMAVTTVTGALVATNAAFADLMEARGCEAHPDALAAGPDAALALFALRRRAMAEGEADGFLPPDLFARLTCRDGRIVHQFEPAAPGAVPAGTALGQTLVDIVPAAAAVADLEGTIHAANSRYHTLAGEGANLADGLVAEDGVVGRLVRQAHQHGTSRTDATLRHTPGRRVRLSANPFPGREDRVMIVLSDVTDQSELEAQIAQSQKMQAIGQLAGGIAHDFNNVLQAIIGFSDLLLQSHRPSDPAFRDIMNIKQSAQRAAGLVKQLLAFSRRQTLRPTVLNLNDVVADLSIMLDRLLGETVKLELAYGRDLWPVLADLSQIEQVVINLSVNARDAMKGGGTLTIRTRNVPAGEAESDGADEVPGDTVLVEIEDVGTGMPQEMLDKIFEPFFTTKATGEGTGLGLSTVYGIVKQTGGALSVKSEVGTGTIFRIYLPRTEVAERSPASAESERAPAPSGDLTGSATLLLVEDEEAIRTFAARALTAKGYRVLSAESGVEAAEIFAEEGDAIDLVVTDVIMPELDGPSLVKKVRAERPDLKVLFMSGYADGASLDELPDAQFLAKPFTLKALAEAVKRELGRS